MNILLKKYRFVCLVDSTQVVRCNSSCAGRRSSAAWSRRTACTSCSKAACGWRRATRRLGTSMLRAGKPTSSARIHRTKLGTIDLVFIQSNLIIRHMIFPVDKFNTCTPEKDVLHFLNDMSIFITINPEIWI